MWAVMFTDLVDSTAQRARIGDTRADVVRREHDEIVAAAVAAHRGVVVKGTGDGAMAAFSSAADAVAAGIAIQQAVERRNRDAGEVMGLRVGVSLGDLAAEGDDLHGMAANEAARLCGVAEHGDVVVSDVVKTVAGTRAGVRVRRPRRAHAEGPARAGRDVERALGPARRRGAATPERPRGCPRRHGAGGTHRRARRARRRVVGGASGRDPCRVRVG